MGRVRPKFIKNIARELLEKYPKAFTTDFQHNKKMVERLTNITSKKVRNRVAGYIVRLIKLQHQSQ